MAMPPWTSEHERILALIVELRLSELQCHHLFWAFGIDGQKYPHSMQGMNNATPLEVLCKELARQIVAPGSALASRENNDRTGPCRVAGTLKDGLRIVRRRFSPRKSDGYQALNLFPEAGEPWSDGKGDSTEDNIDARMRFSLEILTVKEKEDKVLDDEDEDTDLDGLIGAGLTPTAAETKSPSARVKLNAAQAPSAPSANAPTLLHDNCDEINSLGGGGGGNAQVVKTKTHSWNVTQTCAMLEVVLARKVMTGGEMLPDMTVNGRPGAMLPSQRDMNDGWEQVATELLTTEKFKGGNLNGAKVCASHFIYILVSHRPSCLLNCGHLCFLSGKAKIPLCGQGISKR